MEQLVTRDLTLKDEIFKFSHLWPIPVIAFLIGSLLGWGSNLVLPQSHRAEVLLNVAFNADAYPQNPDDYKNWHMEQLRVLALSEDVIGETLHRLQPLDAGWENISEGQLRNMLSLHWRTTGIWRLEARNPDPVKASQAVDVWSQVLLDRYAEGFEAAVQIIVNERQLHAIAYSLSEVKLRRAELTGVRNSLQSWMEVHTEDDQPLNAMERWRLWSLVSAAAELDDAWKSLLAEFPPIDTPARNYLPWIDAVTASIDERFSILQIQEESLASDLEYLNRTFHELVPRNFGVSAYLVVERATEGPPNVRNVRSTNMMALVGGVIGVIAWGLGGLAVIAFKPRR